MTLMFSLDIFLVNDMRQCQEDDVNLFVYLLPDIYTHFNKTAIGKLCYTFRYEILVIFTLGHKCSEEPKAHNKLTGISIGQS